MNVRKIKHYLIKYPWIIVGALTLVAFIFRIWQLGKIQTQVFDEVYFVTFAKNYLSGVTFFDIHPPLGKLIIASGIKIFGDTTFGWRIMSVIFGTALVPLMYFTAKELGGKLTGIFTCLIVTFDGMLLVYSRLGLMDIFLSFFIICAFLFFLKFAKNQKITDLMLAGVFTGLAASVKYSGFSILLVFLIIGIVQRAPFKKFILDYIAALVLLPLAIYLSFFFFNFHGEDFLTQVYQWHWQSLNYNFHLDATHPYGSKWWSWFLLIRPIWLYFQMIGDKYVGVVGLGNPLAWYSTLVVAPILLWQAIKRDKVSIIILAAFLIFYLPWAFVGRVIFIYHAIPSFLFISIGISWLLSKIVKTREGKIISYIYFSVLVIFYLYFLPIWIGLPLSSSSFYHRIWFKGWI